MLSKQHQYSKQAILKPEDRFQMLYAKKDLVNQKIQEKRE